jgi:phosphohistidine phosphatase
MLAGRAAGSARLPWWDEHGGGVSEGGTPGDPGRRLVLLRHAKSDWPDVADQERPLAKRGRRDAPVVGRWLAASGYAPDAVVCSTALRARETWALAEAGLAEAGLAEAGLPAAGLPADGPGVPPAVRYDPRVYGATVLGLLMLIREFEPRWRTAMIVGHNPGLAELTVGLAGPHPEPPSVFPTAAVAVLGLPGAWAEAAPGEARLLAFAVPADMRP